MILLDIFEHMLFTLSQELKPMGWNTEAMRELLSAAFSDEEITTLCFDHFRAVYEDFSVGMSKSAKIQRLVEYCDRHNQMGALANQVQARNPVRAHCVRPSPRIIEGRQEWTAKLGAIPARRHPQHTPRKRRTTTPTWWRGTMV